jgi:uncharacterized heparinase superfamily protein
MLYLRTLRHLRASQLVRGLMWRTRTLSKSSHPDRSPVSPVAPALRSALLEIGTDTDANVIRRADKIIRGEYCFLNHHQVIERIDWSDTYFSRLWNYHLHYFDHSLELAWAFHLTGRATYATTFKELTSDWIADCRPGNGPGWDSYPISLRTVNWMYALLLFNDALAPEFRRSVADSITAQLVYLENRIEWHLLGNHVLKNLKALAIGSLFFSGARGSKAVKYIAAFWSQLIQQTEIDGGHVEGSPMYHAIALADCLELVHLQRAEGVEVRLRKMVRALNAFTRSDKSLRLLNDAARNIAPSATFLESLAATVLDTVSEAISEPWPLTASGFRGWRATNGDSDLIISCREPRPSHQPGHSHCDILSFELDAHGRSVIVDTGVHGYDGDPYREYVRSTRAHNTITIDGKDQSEQWATFRFARRARNVRGCSVYENGVFTFEGSYEPYHSKGATHRRTIRLSDKQLLVTDAITKATDNLVESFLHFHPEFSVKIDGERVIARREQMQINIEPFGVDLLSIIHGQSEPVQGWYFEEFGKAEAQDVLVMRILRYHGEEFGYRIVWNA